MTVTNLKPNMDHWEHRVEMAAAFRWTARLDMHEGVANHFSLAVNDDGSQFLMNPNQAHFSRIRASDLLLIDANDPETLSGPNAPDPTAWGLHGGVHRACKHARCVMHVHSIYATVLACLQDSRLPPIDQNCCTFFNRVVIDEDYGGLAFEDEGDRCAALLTDPKQKVMVMGSHGVLVIGDTVADTFNRLYYFERAAETYIKGLQTGLPLRRISDEIAEKTARELEEYPEQDARHLAELMAILDDEGPIMPDRPDRLPDLRGEVERWNFHPGVVENNPLFDWPPRPWAVLQWYRAYWLVMSTTTLSLIVAMLAVWLWAPTLAETQTLGLGWIIAIWLGFLIPHTALAGGLHVWLYRAKRQGIIAKYDKRGQIEDNGTFTFRSQVKDNMFWSLVSGISFASLYTCAWFWAAGNGWAATVVFVENPVWYVAWFALMPAWGSFHFYWVHRALHWPPLYTRAHALHHRNVNVGPWSGISMHPIEHAIYFSSLLIHFVVPTSPMHIIFHVYTFTLHPICSHSGFDGLLANGDKRMQLGDFFHQLHHRYFECNYGTVEMPWDRWFGTFHDGSEQATTRTRAFKKQMYTK